MFIYKEESQPLFLQAKFKNSQVSLSLLYLNLQQGQAHC